MEVSGRGVVARAHRMDLEGYAKLGLRRNDPNIRNKLISISTSSI